MNTKTNPIKSLSAFACILLCLLFFTACGGPEYVDGTKNLRCDGLYRMVNDTDNQPSYLRFFKEGSVTQCGNITNLQPEDAYEKMSSADGDINNYGNVYRSTSFSINTGVSISTAANGTETVSAIPDITFVIEVQGGAVIYEGTVGEDTLSISLCNTSNGFTNQMEYEFIKIKH